MELKYKLDEDETGLVVTGGEDLVGELVIPAEHDFHGETYPVTSIYHEAFNGCTELTSVIIPETVVAIGYWAFGGCSGLNSIKIPNSVRSIRPDAFYNTGLYNNNENWSEGVLYIGDCLIKAKKECLSATYKIKEGTRLIADEAFENCGNLTEVVIDPTIQYIGIGAFYNCRQLSVVIADRKYPLYIEKKSLEDGTHSSFQDCKNVIKQCGRFKIKDMEDAPTSSSEPYNPYRWIYKVLSIPFTILLSPLSLLLWPVYLVGTSDVKKKLLREKGEKLQWYKVIGIFLLLIIMVLVSINNWIAKLFENIVAFLVKPFKKMNKSSVTAVILALSLVVMSSCHRSGKDPESPKPAAQEQKAPEPIFDANFDVAKMKKDYENYRAQGAQRDSVSFPADCEHLLSYWQQPCLVLAPDVEHYLDSISEITGIPTYNNNDGTMAVRHAVHELHRYQTRDRAYYPVQEVKDAFDAMSQGFAHACNDADDGLRYIGGYYWFCFASQTALLCPVLDYISETHSPDNLVGLRSLCRCQRKMISAIINKRDDHCTVQMSGFNMDLRKVFQINGNWGEDYYLLTSENYANRSAVCLYERHDEELFLVVKARIPLRKMRNGIDVGDDPVIVFNPWYHCWDICVKVDDSWQQIPETKSLYLQLDAVTPYFEVQ